MANASKRTRKIRNIGKELEKFITPEWDTLKEMQENMKDSNDALKYLTHQLYFEETMEVNMENLSYALMLFSATSDLRLVQEGARAVAILMRELNQTSQNGHAEEVIKETLTPITADLNEMRKDLKAIQEKMKQTGPPVRQPTYADATRKEKDARQTTSAEIKRRQILLDQDEGASAITTQILTESQLVAKANEAMKTAKIEKSGQLEEHKFISARKLRNGGLLLETNTVRAADAIKKKKEDFCKAFSPSAKIKDRNYTVRLSFVPVTHEVDSEGERRWIEENSGVEEGHLAGTAWVKPVQKRREGQQVATLVARFSTPQAANKAIKQGLVIQGKRLNGHKVINGPMRCYHCQRYGHAATNCPNRNEQARCPTCAATHEGNQCPAKRKDEYKCGSCKAEGHTAWDQDCPVYRREMEKLIRNNGEIQYKYYRTEEEWTMEIDPVYAVRENSPWTDGGRGRKSAHEAQAEVFEDDDEMEIEDEDGDEEPDQRSDPKGKSRNQSFTQATLDRYGYARQSAEEGEDGHDVNE